MLRADLAEEISGKFLHSYIRTFPHIGSTCPGPHPYAYRSGQKPGGVRCRTSILLPGLE
jgi:hypothetical protein